MIKTSYPTAIEYYLPKKHCRTHRLMKNLWNGRQIKYPQRPGYSIGIFRMKMNFTATLVLSQHPLFNALPCI